MKENFMYERESSPTENTTPIQKITSNVKYQSQGYKDNIYNFLKLQSHHL